MKQQIYDEGHKLQTISSKIGELLSRRQETAPKDILCSICAPLHHQEEIFCDMHIIMMGSMSEVTNRVHADRCPLCRVALHVVSQALASSQLRNLWSQSNLEITLRQTSTQIRVFYDNIQVGCIELYPRNIPARQVRLQNPSPSASSIEPLRPVQREIFGKQGIIHVYFRNIRISAARHLSRKLDLKTAAYHFYSDVPRRLPPRNIDCSFLRSALKDCETGHGDVCEASPVSQRQLRNEIILIDVVEGRLVKTLVCDQRYLALSYVWGTAPMFKTVQNNLASLQQSGALSTVRHQLPRVLQDAMDLTRYLRERYLWCDALCIVQDDALFKHSQIGLMGLIYGQAFLTICALSGSDASIGLLGFSEAGPGGLPLDVAASTKRYAYVSGPSNLEDVVHLLPYESRAWTFQERLLSKRCLFFTATHFYFQCQGAGIRSSNAFGKHPRAIETYYELDWSPFPKSKTWESKKDRYFLLECYCCLVKAYSKRQLTYAEDILDAFTAVSRRCEKFFSCKVKKGVLETAFSCILCWVGRQSLTRRAQRSHEPARPSHTFPSWSWCAWEGPVTFLIRWELVQEPYMYLSYVSHFLLEEEGLVTELKEANPIEHHEKTSRTPICFSPTGHPAMIHFMAFSVESSAFQISADDANGGLLYHNKGWKTGTCCSGEHIQSSEGAPRGSALVNILDNSDATDPPCGGIQMNTPKLLPVRGVIHGCRFILLSTMRYWLCWEGANELWSSKLPWMLGTYQGKGRRLWYDQWALNALLIQKTNGFWERIGIAAFTQEAWDSADPKEEYVQLI